MKIAYLFSRYPVPSQTFCDTEIRALEEAGHEVEIYSCSPPTSSFRHGGPADWPRAPVCYAPPPPVLEAWVEAARRDGTWPAEMVADHEARFGPRYDPVRRARHALYFADRVRRRGVEHVHVHFANRATHAALFVYALSGIPFSFTAHAQDFLVDLGNDDLLRLMCERAAFVVAVSDWSRRALVERCPTAKAKIHRIYNGLDLSRWLPQVSPPMRSDARLKIFSVGRLIEFKGFQDLITACRLLRERGVRFFCEIAGEGPLRATLEQQAAEFSHPDAQVQFSGLLPQEEIRARMESCDVFALASCIDNKGACDVLPTVVLEAMACAKPVVSTTVAGIPEMVEPGQTGMLVPPNAPDLLGGGLESLAGDAKERERMGRGGWEKVRQKFSSTESARQLGVLFAQGRDTCSSAPGETATTSPHATLCCLFDRWPMENCDDEGSILREAALVELRRGLPGAMYVCLKPGTFEATTAFQPAGLSSEVLHIFEFLPDDLVCETYWRQYATLAHRMESWREEAGGACATEEFLLACRRALYLHHTLLSDSAKGLHLHAVGPQSLLCAWLLLRLGYAGTLSFLLPARAGGGVGMAGSTLRKLATRFSAGWVVGERKLAASLGPTFRGAEPDSLAWLHALKQWATGAAA